MVKASKTPDAKYVTITGTPCELTMFYVFWQSAVWPEWADHINDLQDGAITKQHRMVIANIHNGEGITFNSHGEPFESAFEAAVSKCEILGIKVEGQ